MGVFAAGGPQGAGDLPNQYQPSPANALTTNDMLLKISLANSREQLLPAANYVRAVLSNVTSTPLDNIMYYEVTTKNSPTGGEPTADATILFKNTQMVAKSRQFQILNDRNQLDGINNALARAKLSVLSMKATPAVGGGTPEMRDSSYGVIDDLPPYDPNATALAANATAAPAKSGAAAGRAALQALVAAAAGAAALLAAL
ncbi:MAG: hypothetical protein J3K34DRAFT_428663 [Monoraphidium minutum]|nr:MAG: hypothetical protein J3K34DRAFT_428663 [Monoraphidium minutum]